MIPVDQKLTLTARLRFTFNILQSRLSETDDNAREIGFQLPAPLTRRCFTTPSSNRVMICSLGFTQLTIITRLQKTHSATQLDYNIGEVILYVHFPIYRRGLGWRTAF